MWWKELQGADCTTRWSLCLCVCVCGGVLGGLRECADMTELLGKTER